MGSEVAPALREHAGGRMAMTTATRVGANIVSSLLGLGSLGDAAVGRGAQLLTLKFSRDDETEADLGPASIHNPEPTRLRRMSYDVCGLKKKKSYERTASGIV